MSEAASKERTYNYLRQIKGAVVYKAAAMAVSFLTIPLMIGYLGFEQFGVWSTLLTVISWVIFFDLGIGNGLRNKVAEALAKNEGGKAVHYIASGYTLMGIVAILLWVLITSASFLIPWQVVFNTHAITESELRSTVQIAVLFIILNFWIGLIGTLLGAIQKTAMVALGQLITNIAIFAFVYALTRTTEASIFQLALVYGISLIIGNIVISIWFFLNYPELRPRFHLDKDLVKPLVSVGLQFFIIQLAVLVIFTTDKILITQLFGPVHVTSYEVVFKLFSTITFAHSLISMPLWSAYTDAYHREDFIWIKTMLQRQLMIFGCVIAAVVVLIAMIDPIITSWIGKELEVPTSFVIVMGIFALVTVWNNIYAMIVNGLGLIKLQLYTAVIAMCINIPLAIFFSKHLAFGLNGIVLGTVCSLLIAAIALPIQVHSLIRNHLEKNRS